MVETGAAVASGRYVETGGMVASGDGVEIGSMSGERSAPGDREVDGERSHLWRPGTAWRAEQGRDSLHRVDCPGLPAQDEC